MRIKDMKIGTKLIGGFLAVVVIFALAGMYQISSIGGLRNLQDEVAGRAQDAIAIKEGT